MKAWRKQPCPRNAEGRKVKGANRRDKAHAPMLAGILSGNGTGVLTPQLERLFGLGDLPRIARTHLDRLEAERKEKRNRGNS